MRSNCCGAEVVVGGDEIGSESTHWHICTKCWEACDRVVGEPEDPPTGGHMCHEAKSCCCSITALEPDEDCPVHAQGPWPPRCEVCGRFIMRKEAR